MESWNFDAFAGLGPLRFGMDRDTVRGVVGVGFRVFKKSPLSQITADQFPDLIVQTFYDESERLECVEITRSTPVQISFHEGLIFPVEYHELIRRLNVLGYMASTDANGAYFDQLGVAAAETLADKNKVESMTFYGMERFQEYVVLRRKIEEKRQERLRRRRDTAGGTPR